MKNPVEEGAWRYVGKVREMLSGVVYVLLREVAAALLTNEHIIIIIIINSNTYNSKGG